MSNDPSSVRRILPQNPQGQPGQQDPQSAQMGSFAFAPQQFPQRETQKSAPCPPPRRPVRLRARDEPANTLSQIMSLSTSTTATSGSRVRCAPD